MPKLQRPGCDLFYDDTGDGPAIIFAHGAGGNHLSWWQQVPIFAKSYRCIAFDHRGWGQSAATGQLSRAAFIDDLVALMDRLRIERAALVAQSMGGWACLGTALRAPDRVAALVMGGTVGGLMTDTIRPLFDASRERIRSEGLATLAYHRGLRDRDPALAFLYDEVMALNPPRDPAAFGALQEHPPDPDAVSQLAMPILWVAGGDDPINPPAIMRAAHAHVPGSQYYEIPATGHSVYFERADQFNEQLSRFLADAGWGSGI